MTTNITSVNEYSVSGVFDVAASFKEDKDSIESKQVTLRIRLTNVPLKDIITPALSTKRIVWQNNVARKNFNKFKNGQIVEIDFGGAGKNVKSREDIILETKTMFMKAGLDEATALELATKAVDNPEMVK